MIFGSRLKQSPIIKNETSGKNGTKATRVFIFILIGPLPNLPLSGEGAKSPPYQGGLGGADLSF
jgi:hypothetical protein